MTRFCFTTASTTPAQGFRSTSGDISPPSSSTIMHQQVEMILVLVLLGLPLPFLGLFVMISLVTFAIPTHAEWLMGRLGLLITLFLVLVTIYGSAMGTLPSAETPTFLEIWMLSCIMFTLGAFLQTTGIIVKLRSLLQSVCFSFVTINYVHFGRSIWCLT